MYIQSVNNYSLKMNCTHHKNFPEYSQKSIYTCKQDTFERVNFGSKTALSPEQLQQISDLKVLTHHIYEYKKGIRPLFLETLNSKYKESVEDKLSKNKIDYVIHNNKSNINIFFGKKSCVEVIKTLNPKLSEHTPQEDFILGVLLGYDKVEQCSRYLKLCEKAKKEPLL